MKQFVAIAMLAASAAANSQTFEGVPLAPNQQAPLGQQFYQQVDWGILKWHCQIERGD